MDSASLLAYYGAPPPPPDARYAELMRMPRTPLMLVQLMRERPWKDCCVICWADLPTPPSMLEGDAPRACAKERSWWCSFFLRAARQAVTHATQVAKASAVAEVANG